MLVTVKIKTERRNAAIVMESNTTCEALLEVSRKYWDEGLQKISASKTKIGEQVGELALAE